MNKIHDGISILPENSDKVDELSSLDVWTHHENVDLCEVPTCKAMPHEVCRHR